MQLRRLPRRKLAPALLAALVAVAVPLAGATAAGPEADGYKAPRLVHRGDASAVLSKARVTPVVLGGLTSQDWPVVVEISRDGRRVTRAVAGINASLADYSFYVSDGFVNLRVRGGRFGADWAQAAVDFGNGYVADCSGSIRGTFSANRGKVSGTWTYRAVVKDAAGTVVATHDTGAIAWSARQ